MRRIYFNAFLKNKRELALYMGGKMFWFFFTAWYNPGVQIEILNEKKEWPQGINLVLWSTNSFYDWICTTGWNNKIVTQEKMTWFHFRLMKTGFLFLLQTIY